MGGGGRGAGRGLGLPRLGPGGAVRREPGASGGGAGAGDTAVRAAPSRADLRRPAGPPARRLERAVPLPRISTRAVEARSTPRHGVTPPRVQLPALSFLRERRERRPRASSSSWLCPVFVPSAGEGGIKKEPRPAHGSTQHPNQNKWKQLFFHLEKNSWALTLCRLSHSTARTEWLQERQIMGTFYPTPDVTKNCTSELSQLKAQVSNNPPFQQASSKMKPEAHGHVQVTGPPGAEQNPAVAPVSNKTLWSPLSNTPQFSALPSLFPSALWCKEAQNLVYSVKLMPE